MKKFLIGLGILFLAIIILFVIFGGFAFLSASKFTPSVEQSIANFYDHYNKQDFSYIFDSMADEKLKNSGPRENFDKLMSGVWGKLGVAKERKKGAWRLNHAPDGAYFSVQYLVIHEKGESTDSFVLKKHGDSWLMISYNVNSKELF